MKIAFLTREYPPDTLWGGPAIVYHELARALVKRGHEVHVICQAIDKPRDYVDRGVWIHRVGTNPKRYSPIARINYSFYAWQKLKEVIRKYGVEIVEAVYWSAEGFLYSLGKQTPLVLGAQSSAHDVIKAKTYWGVRGLLSLKTVSFLADLTARRADKIIANSKLMYDELVNRVHLCPEKLEVVYHAINVDRFRFVESDIRKRLKVPQNAPLVLSVGRLEPKKGTDILCQAIPQVLSEKSEVRFIFIGKDTNSSPKGGSMRQYVINEAETHHFLDRVKFIDFLSEDELIQLYSACDLFVFPSRHESFGLPVMEAMACGKPVVAAATGIVLELQSHGLKGLKVVPPNDAGELSRGIIEMLQLIEKDGKRQIAEENRKLIETRFSLAVQADRVIEVYNQLLKKRKRKKDER